MSTADEFGAVTRGFNRMTDEVRHRLQLITRERNQLVAVLEGMVEGVVAVDAEERVLHINSVALRVLGVPKVPLDGFRSWELTRVREISDALHEALESRAVVANEVELVGPPERVLNLAAAPLREGEEIVGAVVVFHDVTQLRKLEEMRRDFVANVSHELKTPITVIQGSAEILADEGEVADSARVRFATKIQNQAMRLASLVNDLLALARIESERLDTDIHDIDLTALLARAVATLSPVPGKPQLSLTIDAPEPPLLVHADEESLRQIVLNLLSNAINYTADGGQVRAILTSQASTLQFRVEDTGIGIEPGQLERIFERFYRTDRARTREVGGTGLGLSIVKHLCSSLGGSIEVDSTPGQGSAFTVTLPRVIEGRS